MEGNLKSAVDHNDERRDFILEAPDGGWGYVVVAATVVVLSVTLTPMTVFGLIYGDFLKSIGDETAGTTLSNGIFNTVSSLAGLITSVLLNKYSDRQVGILGAIIFFLGGAALVFVRNLLQMIIFFGVVQGLGFGVLWPAVMSAFNSYFDKKMNVMLNVCHTFISAFNMAVPALATLSMDTFGFRGTMIAVAVLGFLSIPAAATLEPVKKHMRKVYVQIADSTTAIPMEVLKEPKKSLPVDILKAQIEPLINHEKSGVQQARKSTTIQDEKDEALPCWQSMGMPMLGDLKYLNITIGLSLVYTSDVMFISIIPLMLGNVGFDDHQIATVMTVFFASDLVARVVLTLVSYVVTFRSRSVVLLASVLIVIGRIAFVSNDSYMWELVVLGVLGFLRCFIISSLTLVIADEYQNNFATAYSMFMVVMGVVTLIMSPLISLVKSYTQSDVMVCHFLTLAYVSCVVFWTLELAIFRKKKCETK